MRTIPARKQLPDVFLPEGYEYSQTETDRMALGECVYFVITGFTDTQVRVKIGHTKNIYRRLSEHRVPVPDAMVLATFPGPRLLEQVALATAKQYCSEHEGETFTFDYGWSNGFSHSEFMELMRCMVEVHLHLGTRP